MLSLDVTIDTKSGFCFGVEFAIEMAEDILKEEGELYCLGDIVHNNREVTRLEKMGLEIIDHEKLKVMKDVKVLIRAHGEPPSTYDIAIKNNITLIDASCPVVLKLQNRIKKSHDKEEKIYIYGKHGHPEVIGLLGQTGKDAIVFQDIKELDLDSLPKSITLYTQTTKSKEKFYEIVSTLTKSGSDVNVNDTLCSQVIETPNFKSSQQILIKLFLCLGLNLPTVMPCIMYVRKTMTSLISYPHLKSLKKIGLEIKRRLVFVGQLLLRCGLWKR